MWSQSLQMFAMDVHIATIYIKQLFHRMYAYMYNVYIVYIKTQKQKA